jgi:hypothetical protein
MTQPQWKRIANLGDQSANHGCLDYGAFFIYEDTTGIYPPEGELIEELENDRITIYRFTLDQCTFTNGVLSDNPFHPELSVWFAPSAAERAARPQDSNLAQLCATVDITEDEFIALITSPKTLDRAQAWRMVGEYHGFNELDSDPLTLSQAEAEERYK